MKLAIAGVFIVAGIGTAQANCLGSGALPAGELSRFNANPVAYFLGMTSGQQQAAVRQLAASDPSTAGRIMASYRNSSMAQQSAIAAGLGEAARACQAVDQEQARQIQTAALDIDASMRLVFDRAAGQSQVGATGGGGGGGAGGGGGGGGASGGGLSSTAANAQNNGFSGPTAFSRSNGPTSFDVGSTAGRVTDTTSSTDNVTVLQVFTTTPTPPAVNPNPTSP